jgi:hypothetical protein
MVRLAVAMKMKNGERRDPCIPETRMGVDDAFLYGAASLSLFGDWRAPPVAPDPWAATWAALGSDWERVGRDLRVAEQRARTQLGR